MKTKVPLLLAAISALCVSCVQHQVTTSVAEHAVVEGSRYAEEVAAQSPFETKEMSWREAAELMKVRNHDFLAAKEAYQEANEKQPLVQKLTTEVKSAVNVSFGDLLKPQSVLKLLNEPVTQVPKRLASMSKLKDISHSAETSAWQHTASSVDAELKMRAEKVKLQELLREGHLLDSELQLVEAAPPLPQDADPKLRKSVQDWKNKLTTERQKWLNEVRNFFNAEYGDVKFVKDESGLPTYRNVEKPDLTQWERWCQLRRSKELVKVLQKAHKADKPAIPGTDMVKNKLASFMTGDEDNPDLVLDTQSVRNEVRQLIQNWREMKEAQEKARSLEQQATDSDFGSIAGINRRQSIFNFRQREIQHASQVWLRDESCW
ncbi:hypothetical protein [Roseibacillus ishigakijimensis]|uniref:Uncharacterized protein n=1 Tax=Roseibacillus ishigakijimensis TaxID=454146 RepID=A0A934RL77_9BACT|nr:hypothetical protein [Roseibacillus ishigakijimensis]MBK1833767.1 hypothetical protein [Roseibacillus ishigakijimensis]